MKNMLVLELAGPEYVCGRLSAMAGWCVNLSRRVFSGSESFAHSGAALVGVGWVIRWVVNCARVCRRGSLVASRWIACYGCVSLEGIEGGLEEERSGL